MVIACSVLQQQKNMLVLCYFSVFYFIVCSIKRRINKLNKKRNKWCTIVSEQIEKSTPA